MVHGGNNKARTYFKDHGWHDFSGFQADKYTGRIGSSYKAKLERTVVEATSSSSPSDRSNGNVNFLASDLNHISLSKNAMQGEAPSVSLSPKAVKASEAATTAVPPPKPRQPASITIAAPVAPDGASITSTRRPTRRAGGLGARRKPSVARKPSSAAIDWSKIGSDVVDGPVLPRVSKKPQQKSNGAIATNTAPQMSADVFAEKFKGVNAISSADFGSSNTNINATETTARFGNATSLSSADMYRTNTASPDGEDIVGIADDMIRAASKGVAQAADEMTTAFSDFLNKGYA